MMNHFFNHVSRALLFFTRPDQQKGRCYHCERVSTWHASMGFYRCSSCGEDPVEHRPE